MFINFVSHILAFKHGRRVTEGLLEVTGQLELSVKLLKLKIPYKYVVFTEKSQTKKDWCYEFIRLPERRYGNPNRVLNLSQKVIQQATEEGMFWYNVSNMTMYCTLAKIRPPFSARSLDFLGDWAFNREWRVFIRIYAHPRLKSSLLCSMTILFILIHVHFIDNNSVIN